MKEKIFFDSNIFIYAVDKKSLFHDESVEIIKDSIEIGFFTSDLCFLEFYQVITDGRKTPRPLSPEKALLYIQKLWNTPEIDVLETDIFDIFEGKSHQDNIVEYNITRFDIYDYLIAACLKKNQIRKIVTFNSKDFVKYPWITIVDPCERYGSRNAARSAVPSPPSSKLQAPSYIPYGRQSIDERDVAAVCSVLRSDWLTTGPKVAEFEQAVADYVGAKYAVAVSSGTAALHLACLAADIGPSDEVITSPITFVASANCALYVGARPVFADIRPDTYCIDVEEIKKNITHKTKAIVPVNFAGHPCDMDEINKIAKENELVVIEDAAHSLGAEYKGRKVGTLADMTIFSFHPVKHITTGEGGMIVTDNKEYYERLLLLRTHGITKDPEKFINKNKAFHSMAGSSPYAPCSMPHAPNPWYYEMQELGFNYRITDFQCALGISQMEKLEGFVKRRREIAAVYNEAMSKVEGLIIPTELAEYRSSYHLYPIQITNRDRDAVFHAFRERGLGVNVHYIPVHLQPYYRERFGYKEGDFPNAEAYFKRCVSLPVHQGMRDDEVAYVISFLKEK